jgi:hypothetical protein
MRHLIIYISILVLLLSGCADVGDMDMANPTHSTLAGKLKVSSSISKSTNLASQNNSDEQILRLLSSEDKVFGTLILAQTPSEPVDFQFSGDFGAAALLIQYCKGTACDSIPIGSHDQPGKTIDLDYIDINSLVKGKQFYESKGHLNKIEKCSPLQVKHYYSQASTQVETTDIPEIEC